MLGAGCWVLGAGCWVPGCRGAGVPGALSAGCGAELQNFGPRLSILAFPVRVGSERPAMSRPDGKPDRKNKPDPKKEHRP